MATLGHLSENVAYNSIYNALDRIQTDSENFANSIYQATMNQTTDVSLPGKLDAANHTLTVDISTAAGAMAVSIYLEEQSNKVQSASQIAAEEKKQVKTVNQTVG